MAEITSKELTSLSDLLSCEQLLVTKYKDYATCTTDPALKTKYEQIAAKHQQHFDMLFSHLK
ncbi:MAG: ferritin-like domain-containing protein [Clostridia bacterium]|nr:ferritin-like domain-containing protein [Clostridia bacterium]